MIKILVVIAIIFNYHIYAQKKPTQFTVTNLQLCKQQNKVFLDNISQITQLVQLHRKLRNESQNTKNKFASDFFDRPDSLLKAYNDSPFLFDGWLALKDTDFSKNTKFHFVYGYDEVLRFRNQLRTLDIKRKGQITRTFPMLKLEEKAIISSYTGTAIDAELNATLSNGNLKGIDVNEEVKPYYNNYKSVLNDILQKMPKFRGKTYRGKGMLKKDAQRYINSFRQNTNVVEPIFTSTSKIESVADSFAHNSFIFVTENTSNRILVKYIINSVAKKGIYIDPISVNGKLKSNNNSEEEVLFASEAKFKVSKIRFGVIKTFRNTAQQEIQDSGQALFNFFKLDFNTPTTTEVTLNSINFDLKRINSGEVVMEVTLDEI